MAHHTRLSLSDKSLLRSDVAVIDGEWIGADDSSTFDVLDPATGLKWASCPAMTAIETGRACEAAERAFPAYSRMPPRLRAHRLLALDRLVREAKDDLAQLLVLETGKPLAEAKSEIDCASQPPT